MGQVIVRPSAQQKANGRLTFRYTARVRLKGATRCKTFRTETQAKDWIEKEEAKIRKEALEGTLVIGNHTVKDAIEIYKQHALSNISDTWGSIIKVVERYLGDVKLIELKQSDILNARANYKNSRTPPLFPSTVNKFTTCLRNVLKVARRFEMIAHDPFRDFERESERAQQRDRALSEEERIRLLEEAKKSRNPHLWAIINLAIMTGFRRNTIRYLRWSQIDFTENMIRLKKPNVNEQGKKGKPRAVNVPIVPPLRKILIEHFETYGKISDFVFPSLDDPQTPIDFQTAWKVARKNAKLKDFKFHDLRGTSATYLGMMKVPLHIIQQILGHSDPKMTMKYVRTVDDTIRTEMNRVFGEIFQKSELPTK